MVAKVGCARKLGRLGVLVLAAALTTACAERSGPASSDARQATSPKTTHDIRTIGQQFASPRVSLDDAARTADVAVEARVVRIGPTFLNTGSGEFDPTPGMTEADIHELWGWLVPYTTVDLAVTEVLGSRPQRAMNATAGETISVTLLGGAKTIALSPALASTIGLTVPVAEAEGTPDQSRQNQKYPDSPVTITRSLGIAPYLAEGDTVIAFLNLGTIELDLGKTTRPVVISVVPAGAGLFRAESPAAVTFSNAATKAIESAAEIRRVAASLDLATGPAGKPPRTGTY